MAASTSKKLNAKNQLRFTPKLLVPESFKHTNVREVFGQYRPAYVKYPNEQPNNAGQDQRHNKTGFEGHFHYTAAG
jgi:hypothetical protein